MSAIPTSIGRYQVREVIGTGAFATVYRAVDDHLDVDVAIKVLAENHSLDPEIRGRFIEEGRRLRRVRDPHVVTVYDLDDTDRSQPYLVLEWADRGDFARRVKERRARGAPPTAADALTVARHLTGALDELHRNQLVHRDLAPSNLLLRSVTSSAGHPAPADVSRPDATPLVAGDERLLLGDLGLAKDLAATSGLTVAGGTSGFAPPEQRRSGLVDQRSDIWAASAVIVWLATGEAPGEADEPEAWRKTLAGRHWPESAALVLARGLSDEPGQRHPDISVWFEELEAALHARPATETPATDLGAVSGSRSAPGHAPPTRPPRSSNGRRLPVAAVVGALVTGAVLGAVLPDLMGGASGPSTSPLEDGGQRTETEEHGVTIVMEGPTETTVGQPVELSADVDGAASWVWVGPDGAVYPDERWLTLFPETVGNATVRLQAFDQEGHMVEVSRSLEVLPADTENS